MPAPFKNGNLYWVRVPRSDHRRVRVSTGTGDKRTAVGIGRMVDDLAERGSTDVLDPVCDRRIDLMDVWASYRLDAKLVDVRTALDDVDLEPLVGDWAKALRAAGLASADKYEAQVRVLIPAGKRFPRSRFRRKALSEHLASLTEKRRDSQGELVNHPVTGSTRNRHRAALRQFGRWLVEREVLEHNPVSDVRSAAENAPRTVHYAPADIEALIGALDGPYKALEAIMAATGMEWQAVSRLQRRDIDFDAKTIRAHGSKTAWRNRTCRVTELAFWPAIESYARNFLPNAALFEGLRQDIAIHRHHAACKAVKLPHSTLHDHRHSYAVNAIRRGMPLHLVAAQLGHRDSTLVQRVYGKFAPQETDFAKYVSEPVQRTAGTKSGW